MANTITEFTNEAFYRDTVFSKVDFSEQTIREIEFYKCTFVQCNFFKATLLSCEFEDCTFQQCDASLLQISGSKFLDTTFQHCKCTGIDWTKTANPFKTTYEHCILNNNIFLQMDISGMKFTACEIKDADFYGADLSKSSLIACELSGSKFQYANLAFTNFSDSTNYRIDPRDAKFKKTVFSMPEALSLLQVFDIKIK